MASRYTRCLYSRSAIRITTASVQKRSEHVPLVAVATRILFLSDAEKESLLQLQVPRKTMTSSLVPSHTPEKKSIEAARARAFSSVVDFILTMNMDMESHKLAAELDRLVLPKVNGLGEAEGATEKVLGAGAFGVVIEVKFTDMLMSIHIP